MLERSYVAAVLRADPARGIYPDDLCALAADINAAARAGKPKPWLDGERRIGIVAFAWVQSGRLYVQTLKDA